MKPYVIFGAGQYAECVQNILEKGAKRVAAFTVNEEYLNNELYKNDIPIVAFERITDDFPPDKYCMAIGFLGSDMFMTRERIFRKCLELGYELPNVVHPSVINESVKMGIGNVICSGTVISSFSNVGDANVFFDRSFVSHNVEVGDFNLLSANIVPCGNSVIGNHCFIGAGSSIGNRVRIADYTLVGAAAHVAKDTKPYDVVVPARSVVLEHKKSTDFVL